MEKKETVFNILVTEILAYDFSRNITPDMASYELVEKIYGRILHLVGNGLQPAMTPNPSAPRIVGEFVAEHIRKK